MEIVCLLHLVNVVNYLYNMKLRLFHFGHRRVGLGFMHSGAGTSMFKRLSKGNQKRWSRYDSLNSRRSMGLGNSWYK